MRVLFLGFSYLIQWCHKSTLLLSYWVEIDLSVYILFILYITILIMTTDFITAMKESIKLHLPVELHEKAAQFTIPIEFIEKMSWLIILILNSRSMSDASEKQSWFNLLPLMTDDQIAKLNDILTREKQKLDEIEKKYEDKKLEIKKKYLMRRQNMWYIKKMEDMKAAEEQVSSKEQQEADALLENL